LDRLRFEEFLLEKIQDPLTELKPVFLRAFVPVASVRSAETLFGFIVNSNTDLSDEATWILRNLAGNDAVSETAMSLLQSETSEKIAAGIIILEEYFVQNLKELERFRKNNSAEVRRAVASTFYSAKAKMELFEYYNDPDYNVRDIVFNFLVHSDHIYYTRGFLVSDISTYGKCELATDDSFLAFKLAEEVLIIPKHFIVESKITDDALKTTGIYFERKLQPELVEKLLCVYLSSIWIIVFRIIG
jgi:hypothetical protein